jgi:hypothetical protein
MKRKADKGNKAGAKKKPVIAGLLFMPNYALAGLLRGQSFCVKL